MTACASIVEGTTQTVAVATTPASGANCTLQNEKGTWTIPSTPGSSMVVKADGDLTIRCTHPDGATVSVRVPSHTSLATFGNALIGGAVGVAVDLNSGAAYFYPKQITAALNAGGSPAAGTGAAAATAVAPATLATAVTGTETMETDIAPTRVRTD